VDTKVHVTEKVERIMKIAILGTGMVGQTMASALLAKGHEIAIGTRDVAKSLATSEKNAYGMPAFGTWHKDARNSGIRVMTFADAATFGEVLVNATNGSGSLEALSLASSGKNDASAFAHKVLLDISNDLDFSKGMPPTVRTQDAAGAGLGERIQAAYPKLRVVKTLSTMNAFVMVNPSIVAGGESTVFLSGDDADAKKVARGLLEAFGWKDILDLGGIATSRGLELMLPVWLSIYGVLGNKPYNFKIVR
jgi:8-hydroxy-5-deazaflavin:NADPH oxidoreductase